MLDGISDTVVGGVIAITSSVFTLSGAFLVDTIRSKRDQRIKRYELLYSPCISKLETIIELFSKMERLYEQRAGYDPHVGPYNADSTKVYNDYGFIYNIFAKRCSDLSKLISNNIHCSRVDDWNYFTAVRQTMDRISVETALDGNKKFHISVVVEENELISHLEKLKKTSKHFDN